MGSNPAGRAIFTLRCIGPKHGVQRIGNQAETGNRQVGRAVGRCTGALFFAFFGGAWCALGVYALGRLDLLAALLIAAAVAVFVITAVRLQRRGKAAAKNAYPAAERQLNDRRFGIVNAVTWLLVAVLFQVMPWLGYQPLLFPAIAVVVGLHFFPMPPLYRHRANQVTGAGMVIWAILCPLLFHGDTMIGYLALGAGLMLWAGSAWALRTASQLLGAAGL